jgi:hypothetical protein
MATYSFRCGDRAGGEGSLTVVVDRTQQVLKLDVNETGISSYHLQRGLARERARRRTSAPPGGERSASSGDEEVWEEPLARSPAEAVDDDRGFACVATFALKAKAFDEGLTVAVEQLLQRGSLGLPGREAVIAALERSLRGDWATRQNEPGFAEGAALVAASCSLARGDRIPEAGLRNRVSDLQRALREHPLLGKPWGIFARNDALTALQLQRNLLVKRLSPAAAGQLAVTIGNHPQLDAAYRAQLAVAAGLTGPLALSPLPRRGCEPDPASSFALFPPSDSPEGYLSRDLYGSGPIPAGMSLPDVLADRIEQGQVDLRPAPEDGWYAHQLWALEALLRPEASRHAQGLRFGDGYKRSLRQLFHTLFGLGGETHPRHVEGGVAGGVPRVLVSPRLSVEPLPEYYRRQAEGYRFVRDLLTQYLGEEALAVTHRSLASGPADEPLLDELKGMESLFSGAYLASCHELGEEPDALVESERQVSLERRLVKAWSASPSRDPDLTADCRAAVPLRYDPERRLTTTLLTLGMQTASLSASFEQRPRIQIFDSRGRPQELPVTWRDDTHLLLRPVTVICDLETVPDRDALRALCDRNRSPGAILSSLGAVAPRTPAAPG